MRTEKFSKNKLRYLWFGILVCQLELIVLLFLFSIRSVWSLVNNFVDDVIGLEEHSFTLVYTILITLCLFSVFYLVYLRIEDQGIARALRVLVRRATGHGAQGVDQLILVEITDLIFGIQVIPVDIVVIQTHARHRHEEREIDDLIVIGVEIGVERLRAFL